jgi:hypothetical protein
VIFSLAVISNPAFFNTKDDSWLLFVFTAGVGAYLFYRGLRLLQRERLVLNTPCSKVRSASMGLVEMSGQAVGPHTIPSPATGRSCFYYRTLAWQSKRSAGNRRWQKVAEESFHLPFYLDDNTGRVLVDPQGAELDIHRNFQQEFGTTTFSSKAEIPERISSFLARNGVNENQSIKIEEYCIKPKTSLFILGTLGENPGVIVSPTPLRSLSGTATVSAQPLVSGETHSLGKEAAKNSALAKPETTPSPLKVVRLSVNRAEFNSANMTQQAKIAAALIRAGITNPAAWAAAGIDQDLATQDVATQEVAPSVSSTATAVAEPPAEFDPHPASVLMKGSQGPFLISWRSQRKVIQALNWQSTLMVWGGPALTLISIYLLITHYGMTP